MLKRVISVFMLILLLAGCSGSKTEPSLCGISFRADMVYYNESYSFDGRISENGVLTALIIEPEELEGLEFTLDGKTTTVNYKGLIYTPVEGSMPFCRMIEDFYSPIRTLLDEEGPTADSDGNISRGKGADAFTLQLSPMGLPQTLKMPDDRFYVTFYNISVNEDVNE
ncbi:MAG: hypothetical protein J6B93_00730 [Clostridia bacterium]|jgi:hypothetical protein|nr:hypothetical protein [Clostridia bacterium]